MIRLAACRLSAVPAASICRIAASRLLVLNARDDGATRGVGGVAVNASDHDALPGEQGFEAIAGQPIRIEDQRRGGPPAPPRPGHHDVLGIGNFGEAVGTPQMRQCGAAADHLHQSRRLAFKVRRRNDAATNGRRQRLGGLPDGFVLDVGEGRDLVEPHVLARNRHRLVPLRR